MERFLAIVLFAVVITADAGMRVVVTDSSNTWLYDLPSTNDVEGYELGGASGWTGISKEEGAALLASCQEGIRRNKASTRNKGIVAIRGVGFRVITDGIYTNHLFTLEADGAHLMYRGKSVGHFVSFGGAEREIVASILRQWSDVTGELAEDTQVGEDAAGDLHEFPLSYEVGSAADGGTLSGIAYYFYGRASKWPAIYEANKSIITDPDRIRPGMVIVIPKLEE